MADAVLFMKLQNWEDKSFELYDIFLKASAQNFFCGPDAFKGYLKLLKYVISKQYDIEWMTKNAKEFGCKRSDFWELCEDVCKLLGDKLMEVCKYSEDLIITEEINLDLNENLVVKPAKLVVYSATNKYEQGTMITFDGRKYKTGYTKFENSGYYQLYCTELLD